MKKLNLNDLQVTSFVTGQKGVNAKTVKGGTNYFTLDLACETITVVYGTCGRYPCLLIP